MPANTPARTGRLDELVAAFFEGAMIPVKVSFGAGVDFADQTPDEIDNTTRLLRQADQLARLHAPGVAPELDIDAALWAAKVLQFVCNRLVDKLEADTDLPDSLVETEPDGRNVSQHWSVDLVLRALWDLVKRSHSENEADTLNRTLIEIAAKWPLVAVGTPATVTEDRMMVVWNHDCLRRVYVDRIIHRSDKTLAALPLVAEQIRRTQGT